jgi:hypothetical protein
MNKSRSKFVVVDQSLKGFNGHHYEYSVAVARAVSEGGYEPWVLSHLDYRDVEPQGLNWRKVFRQTWTESTRIHIPRMLLWGSLKWLPGMHRMFSLKKESFGFQLRAAIQELKFGIQDHLFIHTLNFVQLLEVIFVSHTLKDPPSFHLVLRQDPGERGRFGIKSSLLKMIFRIAKGCKRLFFYSDTKGLCNAFESLAKIEFNCLPVLYDHSLVLPNLQSPEGHFVVTYLGDGRKEKGFQHLPSIVETTLQWSPSVHFHLQSLLVNPAIHDSELILAQQKLISLKEKYPNQIKLFEKSLSPQEYLDLLCSSDMVLLPYEAAAYKLRSSGILSQAIGAKKMVVVPEGTSLAEVFPAAVGATYKNADDIPGIILSFEKEKTKLAGALSSASREWLHAHSNQSLVKALKLN